MEQKVKKTRRQSVINRNQVRLHLKSRNYRMYQDVCPFLERHIIELLNKTFPFVNRNKVKTMGAEHIAQSIAQLKEKA